ncbi:hypothetical protein G6F64_014616 [Rhizopus arrhizus]|uniref:Uncharacterized protein n=1 Tax=Rhizopus oryzae TaxID=64495 RepID=A0A9P6WT35_RHIOR|nr:hypothetical protein G6F64_014616 [Rhizopus arrhizus]
MGPAALSGGEHQPQRGPGRGRIALPGLRAAVRRRRRHLAGRGCRHRPRTRPAAGARPAGTGQRPLRPGARPHQRGPAGHRQPVRGRADLAFARA